MIPSLRPGKLRNDVVDGKLAHRRLRRELVLLNVHALQLGKNVLLQLGVSRTAHRTRTDRDDLFHVLHDVIAVDVGLGAGGFAAWLSRLARGRSVQLLVAAAGLRFSGCLGRLSAACCIRG